MASHSREFGESVAILVCTLSACVTSISTLAEEWPDSGETDRYVPRILLKPPPNTIKTAIILFTLGMAAIWILDRSGQRRQQTTLAAAGSCILGYALGDSARKIIMVYMPWCMLVAVAAYRMLVSVAAYRMTSRRQREFQTDASTDADMKFLRDRKGDSKVGTW